MKSAATWLLTAALLAHSTPGLEANVRGTAAAAVVESEGVTGPPTGEVACAAGDADCLVAGLGCEPGDLDCLLATVEAELRSPDGDAGDAETSGSACDPDDVDCQLAELTAELAAVTERLGSLDGTGCAAIQGEQATPSPAPPATLVDTQVMLRSGLASAAALVSAAAAPAECLDKAEEVIIGLAREHQKKMGYARAPLAAAIKTVRELRDKAKAAD